MADIKISELERVQSLNNGDLVEVSQEDSYSETGYSSKSAKMTDLGEKVVNGIEYTSELNTSNKKIIGAINEIASYTPVYGNTASGAIATFDTSLALSLQDCTIAINAVQEAGTPTPSSPKLISGFTGANIRVVGSNLTDEQWELGTIDGTTGANTPGSTSLRTTNYIPIEPNTTYYFYIGGTGTGSTNPYLYDQNKQYIGRLGTYLRNQTFTTPSNAYYIRLGLQAGYGTTYNNNISINYPATDTAYHAYNANSNTTPITWQSEAGTVYGGSLDVTSGVLTETWHAIDLGSLNWTYDAGSVPSNPYFFCQRDTVQVSTQNLLCSIYQLANVGVSSMPNYSMKSNNKGQVLVVNHDYSDENTFKTAMSGVFLVCEKLTPETYQLTPTQINTILGTNNIFTDTNGDTSVMYACSLKDYIDSQ